jgi:ATP-dependent 26S proteasome regulatory subunit
MRSALDEAFLRRLRFIVEFPFPDTAQRRAIWALSFPAAVPGAAGLDLDRLAELPANGGVIRNIAMNAAFLAAEAGQPIGMAQLLEAAALEADKLERPISAAETRGWT